MSEIIRRACVFLLIWFCLTGISKAGDREKLFSSIASRRNQDWQAAQKIWAWAEPGYQEEKSSALLAEMLEQSGFTIQRGVSGIPTAFIAEIGSGKPVIAILGEYDALPGLGQDNIPERSNSREAPYGHGCGHHLFGVASASAAIAIGEQIQAGRLKGTIRFYGCPAEEGGSAKAFMARDGLFDDVDAVLHWHPSSMNSAGACSTLARIAVKFRFHGRSAHAAGAPDQGRSALDAVELMNHAAELLREHTPTGTRIHHVITSGGKAPNVVPDFAEVYYYVRHPDSDIVRSLYDRLVKCARGAALATETELEIDYEGGILALLPNNTLAQISLKNLRELNDLNYTEEDRKFAVRLQQTMVTPVPIEKIKDVIDKSGSIAKGSTDVGDISWRVPTAGFTVSCWVPGTPGHSWQAVACGNTPIARQGLFLATRVLAANCWDLLTHPELIQQAQAEHRRRIQHKQKRPLILDDQSPPLHYRGTNPLVARDSSDP